jgi:NAD(P)-dependent dehydrogenase (short-subunit alcohol dehydrogenase family)
MHLEKSVCLITGGTKGIGAATALALAGRGARVAVVGRAVDKATLSLQKRIESLGGQCIALAADIGKPEEARRCVRQTAKQFGSLDVLMHSAGGPVSKKFLELSAENWDAAFAVHVHAIFHLCQEAIPLMQKQRRGAILLVSSVAGLRGVLGATAYQVVKGALPQFARALAREFAGDNIRVNCIAPGIINTAFHAKMPPEVRQNNLANRIPLAREGTPEQVAQLACELIANDYITGETVSIDGGLTMRIC